MISAAGLERCSLPRPRALVLALSLIFASSSPCAFAQARLIQLDDTPSTFTFYRYPDAGGNFFDATVTPDAHRLVYRLGWAWPYWMPGSCTPLYSVPLDGGPPVMLNLPLVGFGGVATWQISPDGTRVVFRADHEVLDDTGYRPELFSVPVEGGPVVKLNGPIAPGGWVVGGPRPGGIVPHQPDILDGPGFRISPDSRSVAYAAYEDTSTTLELYLAAIDGSSHLKLNDAMTSGGGVFPDNFEFTPDIQRVIYVANADDVHAFDLYSVSIGGGPVVKLSVQPILPYDKSLPSNVDPVQQVNPKTYFRIGPDGRRVAYRVGRADDGSFSVYSVPAEGGESVCLSDDPTSGPRIIDYAFSLDGSVLYLGSPRDPWTYDFPSYSIPAGGGSLTPLLPDDPDAAIGIVRNSFRAADGEVYAVYLEGKPGNYTADLCRIHVTSGVKTRLNGRAAGGPDENVSTFRMSPDHAWAVYQGSPGSWQTGSVFAVHVLDGTCIRLTNVMSLYASGGTWFISPDSRRLIYMVSSSYGWPLVYSVPLAGGAAVPLRDKLQPPPEPREEPPALETVWPIAGRSEAVLQGYRVEYSGFTIIRLGERPHLYLSIPANAADSPWTCYD